MKFFANLRGSRENMMTSPAQNSIPEDATLNFNQSSSFPTGGFNFGSRKNSREYCVSPLTSNFSPMSSHQMPAADRELFALTLRLILNDNYKSKIQV